MDLRSRLLAEPAENAANYAPQYYIVLNSTSDVILHQLRRHKRRVEASNGVLLLLVTRGLFVVSLTIQIDVNYCKASVKVIKRTQPHPRRD